MTRPQSQPPLRRLVSLRIDFRSSSPLAQTWRQRLQSEVEAGAALTTLVRRVDLSDSGIRLALKVPIVDGGVQPVVNATELIIRCDVPIQIMRRGVEMRLVIEGNRAPAPRADLALLKAIARALHWSDELLSGRAPINCESR